MPRERVKQLRKETDPSTSTKRLEAHHLDQRHNGGEDRVDNLFGLTLDEHAMAHHVESEIHARNQDHREARCNRGAVNLILKRMSPDEKRSFSNMVNTRLRRRL